MKKQRTILIADDESHIVSVVSLKLQNAGYRIIKACDGQEAFEIAMAERPDLLITDYHMPLLSGIELCQRLRQAGLLIPAILLTARGYDLESRDTEQSKIQCMLSKPFSPRQLLATVQEMLQNAVVRATAA